MCGIAGYFSDQNQVSPDDLKMMTQRLSHRGPDASGHFIMGNIGLGHRRLSIIDLSEQANQPMHSHSGDSVIIFNGEIYNFRELASELNIQTQTTSDTEVVLEAFEKLGPLFINKLNGMFSMAILKKKTNQLYLFRDRLGIKPLYYLLHQNQLVFASELKAFFDLDFFKAHKSIDSLAVHSFLHLGYIPAPLTTFSQIKKFPQGNYAEFDGKSFTLVPYWDASSKITNQTYVNEQDAKQHLKSLVESSVKYRLISDVPYGTFLSGGIDSSLVTAAAQKVSNHQLKTFSIGFAESKFNESEYARQVARHLETDHHEFLLTENDALKMVDEMFDSYDEPFADSSAIPTMLVSKMARQQVTMTLSGDGGDELFHGYGMYKWASRLNHPLTPLIRKPAKFLLQNLNERYQRVSHLFETIEPLSMKSHLFSQEQYFFSENELTQLLNKPLQPNSVLNENPVIKARKLNASESQAFFDMMYYLPDDLLVKVDRASMHYSLENRVPLLDYRIVEFALNLDPHLKTKKNISKYLLKQVLYDYVPSGLFDRPKWGFSIPLNKWLKTDLKYLADEYLSEKRIKEAGFVKYPEVERLKNNYYLQGKTYYYNRIWALICLHRWYFEIYSKK